MSEDAALEIHVAPSWRRALAGLVDVVPIAAAATLIVWLAMPALPESPWNPIDRFVDAFNASAAWLVVPLVVLGAVALAWNVTFQLTRGVTPGKELLGLTIVDARGQRPTRRATVLHCLWRLPAVGLLYFGNLWALADPERRTLHDRLARVYVTVRRRERGPDPEPATMPASEQPRANAT